MNRSTIHDADTVHGKRKQELTGEELMDELLSSSPKTPKGPRVRSVYEALAELSPMSPVVLPLTSEPRTPDDVEENAQGFILYLDPVVIDVREDETTDRASDDVGVVDDFVIYSDQVVVDVPDDEDPDGDTVVFDDCREADKENCHPEYAVGPNTPEKTSAIMEPETYKMTQAMPETYEMTQAMEPETQELTQAMEPETEEMIHAGEPETQAMTNAMEPETKEMTQAMEPETKMEITHAVAPENQEMTNAMEPETQEKTKPTNFITGPEVNKEIMRKAKPTNLITGPEIKEIMRKSVEQENNLDNKEEEYRVESDTEPDTDEERAIERRKQDSIMKRQMKEGYFTAEEWATHFKLAKAELNEQMDQCDQEMIDGILFWSEAATASHGKICSHIVEIGTTSKSFYIGATTNIGRRWVGWIGGKRGSCRGHRADWGWIQLIAVCRLGTGPEVETSLILFAQGCRLISHKLRNKVADCRGLKKTGTTYMYVAYDRFSSEELLKEVE